ncbi:MAG: hypothetical protein LWW79_04835 [Holophagaceae bacterium]|nr:hypothetical protein [Holophagaceae bacterium]
MFRSLMPVLILLALPAFAQAPPKVLDFAAETVGEEPRTLIPIVGKWTIAEHQGQKLLKVDGTRWREGQRLANLPARARALYGERYAEFLDSVKAFAYFPYAVARDVSDFREGDIMLRFQAVAGRVDQASGILFDLRPNGSYYALRANALENNFVLWRVVKGQRKAVKWARNLTIARGQWHELKVVVKARRLEGYLDGNRFMEHTLDQPVSGHVGIWTKADSVCLFERFEVVASR